MTKIAVGFKEINAPWGGGNKFVKSLKNDLLNNGYIYTNYLKDNDIDLILIIDPRFRLNTVSFSIAQIIYYK